MAFEVLEDTKQLDNLKSKPIVFRKMEWTSAVLDDDEVISSMNVSVDILHWLLLLPANSIFMWSVLYCLINLDVIHTKYRC